MGSWFDDWFGDVDEGALLGGAFNSLATMGIGLLNNSLQQDQLDRQDALLADQLAREDERYKQQLQLEALKAKFSGGGGGPAGPPPLSDADKLAALNNQGILNQRALSDLVAGLNQAFGTR